MRTATLGRTGVEVTALGFGSAEMAGLYREVDEATARAAVDAAWESGVRYFDTAPHYGLGLAERRLGAALAGHDRDAYTLSTKVGRSLVPNPGGRPDPDEIFDVPADVRREWDFSRDGVLRCLQDSLQRLGVDRVDLVLIHDPDEHYREAVEGAYPALHELRESGVIRAIGVGMNSAEMLADFVRDTDIDVVMLAGRYTLLEQGGLPELLPLCLRQGVPVLAAAVLNSGLLASDSPAGGATYNYRQAPPELVERARRIAEVCADHGATLPQAALQFPLGHAAVAGVVVGARTADEVRTNAELFARPVPGAVWSQLRAEGLLNESAPAPGPDPETPELP